MAGWNLLKLKLVETYSNLKGFYKNEHLQQPRHHQAPKSAQISHSWHKTNALLWQIASALKTWQQPSLGQSFFSTTWAALQCLQGKNIEVAGWSCCGFVDALVESCVQYWCSLQSSMSIKKNHRSITLMTEWTHHASPVLPMSNLNCLCDRIIHPPGIARVMTPGRLRAHRLGYDLFPPEMLKPHGSSMLSFFSARGGHFPRLDLQNWLLFFTWHDWLILSGWVITTNHLT